MRHSCVICGVEFSGKPRAKFCTHECYSVSKRGKAPWNKGVKTGIAPWLGKARDEATRQKIRETKAIMGYRHPQNIRDQISQTLRGKSRGGNQKLLMQLRGIAPYQNWRRAVFERDNYTCQICQERGGELNADHIKPFAALVRESQVADIGEAWDCPTLWDVANGRTLCLPCHRNTATFGNRKAA